MSNHLAVYELWTSLQQAGIPEESIEPYYISQTKKFNLLVKLQVDCEGLPVPDNSPNQTYAGLLFSMSTDGTVLSDSLVLSPYLETLLSTTLNQMQVSSYSSLDERFIYDFQGVLQNTIDKMRTSQNQRRTFVAGLLTLFPTNVAEYDQIFYNDITLHFGVNESRYLVYFKLDGEREMTFFALDRPVKVSGERVWSSDPVTLFNESFKLPKPSDDLRDLQEFICQRLNRFISDATANTKIPLQK